jgi:adenylate kinase
LRRDLPIAQRDPAGARIRQECSTPDLLGTKIAVDDEEIVSRLSGRRVHEGSGRIYHVKYDPPKTEGKDDETGDALIQREDDKEETVRKRLKIYHEQTAPLVGYYQDWAKEAPAAAPKYVRVKGVGSLDDIRDQILTQLK